jgi:hypothetical protein
MGLIGASRFNRCGKTGLDNAALQHRGVRNLAFFICLSCVLRLVLQFEVACSHTRVAESYTCC